MPPVTQPPQIRLAAELVPRVLVEQPVV